MTTYLDVVDAVRDYYGTGSDIWYKVAQGPSQVEYTPKDLEMLQKVPGVQVTVSRDGRFRGWDYNNPFPSSNNPVSNVNSNVPNSSYGSTFSGRVNGTYHWDGATQTGRLTSGARKVGTGARVATVAGKLNVATTAVAAGMFFGAKIDSALYNIGKFFDLNPPEALNPETWDSIATTDLGKSLIRHLFDIDGDGGTTAYMPEDVLDYMYRYWLEQGIFNKPDSVIPSYNPKNANWRLSNPNIWNYPISVAGGNGTAVTVNPYYDGIYDTLTLVSGDAYTLVTQTQNGSTSGWIVSDAPFTIRNKRVGGDGTTIHDITLAIYTTSVDGNTYYFTSTPFSGNISALSYPVNNITSNSVPAVTDVIKLVYNGDMIPGSSGVPGVEPDPRASERPDPSQIDPTQPLLPQLKQQMPNTFGNPIKENVPQPDGTNKEIVYYPVPWPKITDDTDKPVSGTPTQSDPTVTPTNPTDETDPIRDVITNPLPQPETPTPGPPASPPDTGSGSTPTVVPPTGNASSLWAIYNPTQSQLDAFGAWLWSSDFVEQIKKLFNDPMQAIVGVHKVFATPSTSGQVNIKCGYIDSGCPAARVSSQYTTIDCGTVSVREYYGNIFDYSPYTEISLYLPFIGIVKLDTADVMRGSVQVKYHVDVITGACLADVIVKRDGENAVMYQYSGSAIVTYPISSGSYASMVTGILSLAAGVAGTIMTGGAAAPALIGGAVGLSHLHTDVQKSGGFSGSPGAMGCKKPYLIISRAQDALPADFEKYEGKPASKTVKIGDCDGFIKVKQINIDGVPATYGELDQIVSLLKQGVIV